MLAAFASVMEGSSVPVGAMDSITLGQLKSMVDSQPKAKVFVALIVYHYKKVDYV